MRARERSCEHDPARASAIIGRSARGRESYSPYGVCTGYREPSLDNYTVGQARRGGRKRCCRCIYKEIWIFLIAARRSLSYTRRACSSHQLERKRGESEEREKTRL